MSDTLSQTFIGLCGVFPLCNGSQQRDNIWVLLAGILGTQQFLENPPRDFNQQQKRDNATDKMSKTLQWSFNCCFISPHWQQRRVNSAPASGNCYLQVPTVRYCFSFSFSLFWGGNSVRRLQMRSFAAEESCSATEQNKIGPNKNKMQAVLMPTTAGLQLLLWLLPVAAVDCFFFLFFFFRMVVVGA